MYLSVYHIGMALFCFGAVVTARRGLNPSSLSLLTRGTDYTFHSICADFHNPDIYFDEMVLFALSLPACSYYFPFNFLSSYSSFRMLDLNSFQKSCL